MYWLSQFLLNDRYLHRVKEFPPAVETPELSATEWSNVGNVISYEPHKLDVNFCHNTMCGHFGLSHSQAAERGEPYQVRRKGNQLSLICPECDLNRKIYNNEAVDAMFLHVLKNHLTHEHCQNDKCPIYRYNLNEYYGDFYNTVDNVPTDEEELKNYKYQVKCPSCSSRFTVGDPWRIHDKGDRRIQGSKKTGRPYPVSPQVFMKLVCNGIGPSAMIELTECNPGDYYAMLHNLARACNTISGRHLMELQSVRYAKAVNDVPDNNTLRLYSDMMEISILLDDKDKRIKRLQVLITVTDYRDSFFALAVTPMFMPITLPKEKMKSFRAKLRHESLYLESHQPHAYLGVG